jgi:hypothetical protein
MQPSASSPKEFYAWMTNICYRLEILEALYSLGYEGCKWWCLESASKLSQVRPPNGIDKIPVIETPEGQLLFGAKRKFLEERGFDRILSSGTGTIDSAIISVHKIPKRHSLKNEPYVIVDEKEVPPNVPKGSVATIPHPRPGYKFLFLTHLRDDETCNILSRMGAVRFSPPQSFIVVHDDSCFMKLLLQSEKSGLWESRQSPHPNLHLDAGFVDRSVRGHEAGTLNGLLPQLAERHKPFNNHYHQSFESCRSTCTSKMVQLTSVSGSGKTRGLLEVGTATTTVYFCFGNGGNGMVPSITGHKLTEFMSECAAGSNLHRAEYPMIVDAILFRLLHLCKELDESIPDGQYKYFDIDKVVEHHANKDSKSVEEYLTTVVFVGLKTFRFTEAARNFWDRDHIPFLNDGVTFSTEGRREECVDLHCPRWREMSMQQLRKDVRSWLDVRQKAYMEKFKSSKLIRELPKLVIVFDEVHHLMAEFSGDKARVLIISRKSLYQMDWYDGFRRTFCSFAFYWRDAVIVTVSTAAKLDAFHPPPQYDSSYRGSISLNPLEPIVFNGAFDLFVAHGRTFGRSHYRNWFQFIFSLEIIFAISSCGRVSIAFESLLAAYDHFMRLIRGIDASISEDDQDKDCPDLSLLNVPFEYILRETKRPFNFLGTEELMLLPLTKIGPDFSTENGSYSGNLVWDPETCCALLGLSVGLAKFPRCCNIEALVQYHGMHLLKIDMWSNKFRAMFLSEGVLNGVASVSVNQYLLQILQVLRQRFLAVSPNLPSPSEFAGLLERIFIIVAMCRAKRRVVSHHLGALPENDKDPLDRTPCEMVFEPVGLEDFLDAFVGKDSRKIYIDAHPALSGAFLSFNHLDNMPLASIKNPYDIMAKCMYRGAACIPPRGLFPTIDLLLPMVLGDGRLSFFVVQTKYGPGSQISPSTILEHCPQDAFGVSLSVPYGFLCHQVCLSTEDPENNPDALPSLTKELDCQVLRSEKHSPCLAIVGSNISCLSREERRELYFVLHHLDDGSFYKNTPENKRILDYLTKDESLDGLRYKKEMDLDSKVDDESFRQDALENARILNSMVDTAEAEFDDHNSRDGSLGATKKSILAHTEAHRPVKPEVLHEETSATQTGLRASELFGVRIVHKYRTQKSVDTSSS